MIELLRFECIKLIHRRRTFLSIGLMMVLVCLIFWGLKSEGTNALAFIFQSLDRNFEVQGNVLNGYLACFLILNTLWIHVPVLISIVTGDLFSSELENGTIRILMTRPISRNRVALSKHFTAVVFVFFFIICYAIISIIPALILFGKGDLIVAFNGLQIIEESQLPLRFLGAFGFAFLAMTTLAILSVTVSFFVRKSLVSILITLGFIIISTLLQTLSGSLFTGWEFFLITYHFSQWQLFFYSHIDYGAIANSTIWLLLFSIVCIVISIIRFKFLKITE
ncbi:ABC transporter permease [Flavobacterium granuli]|uniref:ABC-2 type transport system permease protein n=1 Tax=Flavobacterium granuli TaxID=280093 RepID=A0ABU1S0T1_9FLAO|nr:ABC transporter permease [Flavobacterium granuli]MDR6844642.1 ABC-2 type transport system permease protein [Flavobacterium granuli]